MMALILVYFPFAFEKMLNIYKSKKMHFLIFPDNEVFIGFAC